MDLEHTYQGIRFEWDSHKEEGNLKKHGISFKTACEAFLDPFVLPLEEKIVDDELRENIIGMTTDQRFIRCLSLERRKHFADYLCSSRNQTGKNEI